jgi:hypothetical protein
MLCAGSAVEERKIGGLRFHSGEWFYLRSFKTEYGK